MRKRRYSYKNYHLWPFTWSTGCGKGFRLFLDSGAHEGGGGDCHIRIGAFGYTLICELPPIIPHYRERHVVKYDRDEFIARMGRDWYDELHSREYGFTFFEGALHVHFGAQTGDSRTDKNKVFFLPWRSWRFIRESWYDLQGKHFATEPEGGRFAWEAREAVKNAVPKVKFDFEDYDGQRLVATSHIEEREWHFGTGWFRWLSWFRKPQIRRTLALEFNGETGKEKGSWKGGTIGTSIEMLPGELHESAFKRYCEQEHHSKSGRYRVRYIGPTALETPRSPA